MHVSATTFPSQRAACMTGPLSAKSHKCSSMRSLVSEFAERSDWRITRKVFFDRAPLLGSHFHRSCRRQPAGIRAMAHRRCAPWAGKPPTKVDDFSP